MRQLFPLRPIQMVDISFQLMRDKFVRNMLVSLGVCIPLQSLVWILYTFLENSDNTDLEGRTVYLMGVTQFGVVGMTLAIVSNILNGTTIKTYTLKMFERVYYSRFSSTRILIVIYQIAIQIIFITISIFTRYLLGQSLSDDAANTLAWTVFTLTGTVWVMLTLYVGFTIPIASNENIKFFSILKRTNKFNMKHFPKLFGAYCVIVFIGILLVLPSLTLLQIIISNNVIKTNTASSVYFNLNLTVIISLIAVAYSYLLTVAYFNARIENEGFDITFSIEELSEEGRARGELFHPLKR